MGPILSMLHARAMAPWRETLPKVGRRPVQPQRVALTAGSHDLARGPRPGGGAVQEEVGQAGSACAPALGVDRAAVDPYIRARRSVGVIFVLCQGYRR